MNETDTNRVYSVLGWFALMKLLQIETTIHKRNKQTNISSSNSLSDDR